MTKQEFVQTYLEGAKLAPEPELIYLLVSQMYDERKLMNELSSKIEFMDDVARDQGYTMKCKCCKEDFTPDCELSEMYEAEVYCGKNQWCTP